MEKNNKILAFEYVLYKLVEWHKEVTGLEHNDISILKALKLLFFISAVEYDKETKATLLDIVFNKFVAMPYGHVETEIYDIVKNGELTNVTIDTNETIIHDNFDPIQQVTDDIRSIIDKAIQVLKSLNNNLIEYTSFQLVDLSHSWYSWKYYFSKAQSSGVSSISIPSSVIKSEDKFYELSYSY